MAAKSLRKKDLLRNNRTIIPDEYKTIKNAAEVQVDIAEQEHEGSECGEPMDMWGSQCGMDNEEEEAPCAAPYILSIDDEERIERHREEALRRRTRKASENRGEVAPCASPGLTLAQVEQIRINREAAMIRRSRARAAKAAPRDKPMTREEFDRSKLVQALVAPNMQTRLREQMNSLLRCGQ
jgi:hypothetical protein